MPSQNQNPNQNSNLSPNFYNRFPSPQIPGAFPSGPLINQNPPRPVGQNQAFPINPNFSLPSQKPSGGKNWLLWIFVVAVTIAGGYGFYLVKDRFLSLQGDLTRKYYGSSSQCVAYVKRYYKNVFDIEIGPVGVARNMMKLASRDNLYAHENGGNISPQPGDILVFDHSNKIGHVAIITDVLKDGVMIMEQNWGTSVITNNNSKPLPLKVDGNKYFMPERDGFKIMGWVSRTAEKPPFEYDFSDYSPKGWIASNDNKMIHSEDGGKDYWTIKVVNKEPAILSPLYFQSIGKNQIDKMVFRARVLNNPDGQEGIRVFVRSADDKWSRELPMEINQEKDGFNLYQADLSLLEKDFKFKQFKIILTNPSVPGKEMWEINWVKFTKNDKVPNNQNKPEETQPTDSQNKPVENSNPTTTSPATSSENKTPASETTNTPQTSPAQTTKIKTDSTAPSNQADQPSTFSPTAPALPAETESTPTITP